MTKKSDRNLVAAPPGVGHDSDSDEDDESPPSTNDALSPNSTTTNESQSNATTPVPVASTSEPQGRGHQQKYTSTRLKDYVVQRVTTKQPPSLLTTTLAPQTSSGTQYPICNFVSCDRFSQKHLDFVMALSATMEPRSFIEAMKDERWGVPVDCEITSLEKQNTWRLEHLPPGKKALGCK